MRKISSVCSLRRGRLRHRSAEGGEEGGLARFGGGDVLLLDVAEAAHAVRQARDLDGERVIVGDEAGGTGFK